MNRPKHTLSPITGNARPSRVLFVDTETYQRKAKGGKREHRLRLGYALMTRSRRDKRLETQSDFIIRDLPEFWAWVDKQCPSKSRLYLVSHNLNFDLPVLKAFSQLPKLDWEITGFYSQSKTAIFRWRDGNRKIFAVDNHNLFPGSLEKWGDVIGLPKGKVDFKRVSRAKLLEYCKNDVEIMRRLWMSWLEFLDKHDLGKFGNTIASTAFTAYRYRFMDERIIIHDDPLAGHLERAAYHGGRVECLYQGKVSESNYHYVDVNSMYGFIMSQELFPAFLWNSQATSSLKILAKRLDKYAVIARVQVQVTSNYFPLRIDGVLTYPLGKFWTTLSTPELKLAQASGWIKAVSHVAWYHQFPLFKSYADYMLEVRRKYQKSGQDDWAKITKLLINGLYGKFAQKGYQQSQVGTADPEKAERLPVLDVDTNERSQYVTFGGKVFHESRQGESYNSFPAITAHVTAYARLYLNGLRERVPQGHIYYMDTDALIVDDEGLESLAGFFDDQTPGMLRIEHSSPWLVINAPKDYSMLDRVRHKGKRKDAKDIAGGKYVQHNWKSIRGLIAAGDVNTYFTQQVTKSDRRVIRSGEVHPEKWVFPFVLAGSEDAANGDSPPPPEADPARS